jgi:hypothetical protein
MPIVMPLDEVPCQPFRGEHSRIDFAGRLSKDKKPRCAPRLPSAILQQTGYLPDIPPMPMPMLLIGANMPPGPNL